MAGRAHVAPSLSDVSDNEHRTSDEDDPEDEDDPDEIEEELRSQQANFERDVGRLRKQYERRGRALRAAKAAKEAAREQSS